MVVAEAAGVDTWKLLWQVDPDGFAADQMASLATGRASRGRVMPDSIAGHRVGFYNGPGVIYAEGHPAGKDTLCAPAQLVPAFDAVQTALLEAGVPLPEGLVMTDFYGERIPGFSGVGRLDSTLNLRTDSAVQGAAIMAGVAALLGQTGKQELWRQRGRLETVTMHGHGGKRVTGRWYDKGVEAGIAPVGRLLRPEDQRRWERSTRRDVEELTGGYVRSKFHDRWVPVWRASKGVTVAGPLVIAGKLKEAVDAGEVSASAADRMAGFLLMEAVGLSRPGRTQRRKRREVQDLGLVLADGVLEEVEVSLEEVMEACLDADGWGAQG